MILQKNCWRRWIINEERKKIDLNILIFYSRQHILPVYLKCKIPMKDITNYYFIETQPVTTRVVCFFDIDFTTWT